MASEASSSAGDAIIDIKPDASGYSTSSNGLRIVFKDLNYHVPSNRDKKERAYLLKSVTAYLEPGEMTALMGPSGSGKTTLLDLLAGRKTVGTTEGHLTFGGVKPSPQFLRRYTGYVEQFDTLIADLTVREMLMYTAELKRERSESLEDKKREVDVLLTKLALDVCADVRIGDPMAKGISGGQAKRTNIGIALISNPRVLFLDEPTSGLDSFTSNEVMKVVSNLKADGTTIVATIHSPTAATFALFDRVMMLVRGQLVYFGQQGMPALEFAANHWPSASKAKRLLKLQQAAADQHASGGNEEDEMQDAFNDAEVLVDTVTEADIRKEADALAAIYNGSELRKENDRQVELYIAGAEGRGSPGGKHRRRKEAKEAKEGKEGAEPAQLTTSPSGLSEQAARELATRSDTVTPWWWGVLMLLKYRTTRNYKNPGWLGPRIADKLLVSLIMLTLYLGIGDNFEPQNLINIQSALFMWALLPAFGAASYVPAIVLERRLFVRERSDGLYRVGTYLAAKLLEELMLALIITLVLSASVFYAIDLQGDWVVFWLVYFIDLATGIVLAYFIAALSPNMDVANAALPAFVVTLLFFAGQLITLDSIPNYWYWYSVIDFLRYAWGALMVNQFEDNNVILAGGKQILEYYSLGNASKWDYIGYLSIFWFVFAFLALLALTYVKHQKR